MFADASSLTIQGLIVDRWVPVCLELPRLGDDVLVLWDDGRQLRARLIDPEPMCPSLRWQFVGSHSKARFDSALQWTHFTIK